MWGLLVIGFFWVHGGIYGNEAMLMAAPPAYVFLMLGIVPFVYLLPIALIVAELSTAFPEDGGYVVWVRDACGQAVGSHHAYWVWVRGSHPNREPCPRSHPNPNPSHSAHWR